MEGELDSSSVEGSEGVRVEKIIYKGGEGRRSGGEGGGAVPRVDYAVEVADQKGGKETGGGDGTEGGKQGLPLPP